MPQQNKPQEEKCIGHCDNCSYAIEERWVITGCGYCGCHEKKITPPNLNEQEGWKERFEKEFSPDCDESHYYSTPCCINTVNLTEKLKDFIRSVASQSKEEGRREADELIRKMSTNEGLDLIENAKEELRVRLLQEVGKMKKVDNLGTDEVYNYARQRIIGFNSAIDEVLLKISNI